MAFRYQEQLTVDADRADIIQCSDFPYPTTITALCRWKLSEFLVIKPPVLVWQWEQHHLCHVCWKQWIESWAHSSICILKIWKKLLLLTLLPTQISVNQGGEWALLYIRSQCPWRRWLLNPALWDECEAQNQPWCQELSISAGWCMKGCPWIKNAQQGGYSDFVSPGHLLPSTCESELAYLGHGGLTCLLLNKSQHSPQTISMEQHTPKGDKLRSWQCTGTVRIEAFSFWMELRELFITEKVG